MRLYRNNDRIVQHNPQHTQLKGDAENTHGSGPSQDANKNDLHISFHHGCEPGEIDRNGESEYLFWFKSDCIPAIQWQEFMEKIQGKYASNCRSDSMNRHGSHYGYSQQYRQSQQRELDRGQNHILGDHFIADAFEANCCLCGHGKDSIQGERYRHQWNQQKQPWFIKKIFQIAAKVDKASACQDAQQQRYAKRQEDKAPQAVLGSPVNESWYVIDHTHVQTQQNDPKKNTQDGRAQHVDTILLCCHEMGQQKHEQESAAVFEHATQE